LFSIRRRRDYGACVPARQNQVMGNASIEEQRLAFGRVAALYENSRPSYPAQSVDS